VWVALGNPCSSTFVPCFPPAVAPELADAEQWRRFAALRDRVEAEPDRLPDTRAVLAAVEDELWDAADAAFAAGDPSRLTAFAGTSFSAWTAPFFDSASGPPTTVPSATDG